MKNLQLKGALPKKSFHSLAGFIFIQKLLEWLMTFNPQLGLFDPKKNIKISSHDNPFHHYVTCLNGRPLWAEGQGLVADLLSSLKQPAIQFEVVETEKGMRFYAVIITTARVTWHSEVVNKAYAFGTSKSGTDFYAGERTFRDPLIWDENLEYRHFMRFI